MFLVVSSWLKFTWQRVKEKLVSGVPLHIQALFMQRFFFLKWHPKRHPSLVLCAMHLLKEFSEISCIANKWHFKHDCTWANTSVYAFICFILWKSLHFLPRLRDFVQDKSSNLHLLCDMSMSDQTTSHWITEMPVALAIVEVQWRLAFSAHLESKIYFQRFVSVRLSGCQFL